MSRVPTLMGVFGLREALRLRDKCITMSMFAMMTKILRNGEDRVGVS